MTSRRRDAVEDSYKPIVVAERVSTALFYSSSLLSIAALLVPSTQHPIAAQLTQVLFALSVMGAFISSLALRLYWGPRAQRRRIDDLVSHAFGVAIIDKQSSGYYNTKETEGARRLNSAIMENSFFGKAILAGMLPIERGIVLGYVIAWFAALFFRSSDITWLVVAAQALFSEQLLSRWLRIETLRLRFEAAYTAAHQLANLSIPPEQFLPRVIQNFGHYEVAKATAGISLSSRVFRRLNAGLSRKWEAIEQNNPQS